MESLLGFLVMLHKRGSASASSRGGVFSVWTQTRNEKSYPLGRPSYKLLGVFFTDLMGPAGVARWQKSQKVGRRWEERSLEVSYGGEKGLTLAWSDWESKSSVGLQHEVKGISAIRWSSGRDFQNGDMWVTSNPWDFSDRRVGLMNSSGDLLDGVTQ